MQNNFPRRVHFVGIGGIGMSGLAQHLLNLGCEVSGSDRNENAQTKKLRKLGARVFSAHSPNNIEGAELVVRTSAVNENNAEIAAARNRGIPVILREELLGRIFDSFPVRIAVCGTHGKTTVTAMIHCVLERCGIAHTAFIGGEFEGNNYFCCAQNSTPSVVVAEACEYNRSFLNLHPTLCVCLNVEFDHPDCYADLDDVKNAFRSFFCQSDNVILNKNQKDLWQKAILFGRATERECLDCSNLPSQSVVVADGDFIRSDGLKILCRLSVCGEHNLQNAAAAVAVANFLGLPLLQASRALFGFHGVDRRWTVMRKKPLVVCDYAHHPTEIAAAIQTAKTVVSCEKSHIYCVFQPHTYSRTKALMAQFAECFVGADTLVILPVFAAREKPSDGATAFQLYKIAKKNYSETRYFASFKRASSFLKKNTGADDIILLVGAGDINQLAEML